MSIQSDYPYIVRLPFTWPNKSSRDLIPWLRDNVGVDGTDWALTGEHQIDADGIGGMEYVVGFRDQIKATAFRIFWA